MVDLCHKPGNLGRTGQLVVVEKKMLHVYERAELDGDRACQRKWKVFSASDRLGWRTIQGKLHKRGLTCQNVAEEIKVGRVDQLAELRWD